MKISNHLDSKLVVFLDAEDRDEVISSMVNLIGQVGYLKDEKEFHDAIMQREQIVSTGIGMGVAIPHAKLASYDDFFIAIGILKQGVEWNALDGSAVRVVFMIGGPDDKQTEYLQILSDLTLAIKDEERRKKLLTLNAAEDIMKLFQEV